jgi:MoxR-like ATPase
MASTTRTTRAARPRTAPPKSKVKVSPDDILNITRWLDTEVLIERALELRILVLGMLSGTNVHMIGAPGLAKSLALREFARCIEGAQFFEKTLHAQTPADSIIGGFDMELFVQGGGLVRKVEGYAPTAHVLFLDELPRANGPTLDACLPLMNAEERRAEHNGGMMDCPTLFACTASNSWFDADNTQAQALADRVTLMLMVHDLKSDESFKDLLRRHHIRRTSEKDGTWTRPSITLEQAQQAQTEVMHVQLGGEFLDAFAKVRRSAANEGLPVSPRRWVELARVCRASAWMAGRTETVPDDLVVCEHGMWREAKDIPVAGKLVQEFHGRFVREARDKRTEAAGPLAEVEQIRPQVEGTPPNQDLDPSVIKAAINASRKIDEVKGRVEAVLQEAEREKRDAPDLRDLDNELLAVQKWFKSNNLPTQYKG